MKNTLKVKIKNQQLFYELTGEHPKKETVVVSVQEAEVLLQCGAIELTRLQEAILRKNQEPEISEPKQPTETETELLMNPVFFDLCINETGKKAIGEIGTKKVLALACIGRLVENCEATSFNIVPNDESGVGKDHLTKTVCGLFVPKECLIHRTRISPMVLNYWHNPKYEKNWTWNGKVLFLEDVSDSILNCEVLKTFLSGGSKATILVKQMVVDIQIRGKPIIFLTFANATPGGEQLRRLLLVPLDNSPEQTRRIKRFQAEQETFGEKPEYNPDFLGAIECLKPVRVSIPFAELLPDLFPNNTIMRTAQKRFFDFIRASAAFHQFQRQTNENRYLLAEGADYSLARDVFLHTIRNEKLIPVSKNQQQIIDIMRELDTSEGLASDFVAVSDLQPHITFLNQRNLYENLDLLANCGFLEKGRKEVVVSRAGEGREITRSVAAYKVARYSDFSLPTWEELILKLQNSDNSNNSNKRDKSNKSNKEETGTNSESVNSEETPLLSQLSQLSLLSHKNEKTQKCKKCGKPFQGRATISGECPDCLAGGSE